MHFFLREDANARVVMVARRSCRIELADGIVHEAASRGKLYDDSDTGLVAGDEVWAEEHHRQWTVERVLPRRNEYLRLGQRKERQVMFANVDRVVVLASLAQPETKPTAIDRFLLAAMTSRIPVELVLTKCDMDESRRQDHFRELYSVFALPIHVISNATGEGIDELSALLSDGVTALIGNSGVGKTSLLNKLVPGIDHKVAEVSAWSGKGVHTTTAALMIRHGERAALIDTPGMKSFVPYGISEESLLEIFPEIGEYARQCRFRNCGHETEPDCAVNEAVNEKKIAAGRFLSYQRIREGIRTS